MDAGALVFDGALWLALPVALLAGVLSFLSPCILPLVPGYLGFIAGTVAPKNQVSVLPSDGATDAPSRADWSAGCCCSSPASRSCSSR